jgi:ribosome-associated protein
MAKPEATSRRLAVRLARACAENRCRDVVILDLRNLSPVTDFFVLATGTSARQMGAVVQRAIEAAAALGDRPFGVEGETSGWWALLDFVDVVMHVFADEARRYYDLGLLWGDAKRINWQRGWKRPVLDQPPAGDVTGG